MPSKDTLAACLSYEGNCIGGTDSGIGKLNLIMELQGHILHGVFHSNGFGHLLCINGLEMGSDLPGYQVMDFWDRLCNSLQARLLSLLNSQLLCLQYILQLNLFFFIFMLHIFLSKF